MKKTPAKDAKTGGSNAPSKAETVSGKSTSSGKKNGKFVPRELTPEQQKSLHGFEKTISTGLSNFLEVGKALKAIDDQKLYEASCETFAKYCRTRWGMSASYAYRHINAADCVETLKKELVPQGVSIFPINECQVRPLADKPKKRQKWASIWKQVVAKAGDKVVTGAMVLNVIKPPNKGKKYKKGSTAKETPKRCLDAVAKLVKTARRKRTELTTDYYKQLLDQIWVQLQKHL